VRSVAASLVGTGLPAKRANLEIERLLLDGPVVEIGRDALGLPRYSTPEMLAIEREVVATAQALTRRSWQAINPDNLADRCRSARLNAEQTEAVLAAASGSGIAIIEGAPGVGKTSLLVPLVSAFRDCGCRVIGTATAWRVANMLRDDLSIESRATASWIAALKSGQRILDRRTVLIADEAGLLSSREMHTLLGAVSTAGAKLVLVGDRKQLQAIGAGPGLSLVARAVEAARVDTIVRQRDSWAREAVTAFGIGRAATALKSFADRDLLIEVQGAKAAICVVANEAERVRVQAPNTSCLIIAKSNAAVAAISREVRQRRKAAGLISGKEISFVAATPSGHATEVALACGDQIRFLVRNDELGVINGSIATVLWVREKQSLISARWETRVEAEIQGRRISFDPMVLADSQGRPRIGWAYAVTVHGAQGLTVDRAIAFVDPNFNRHDIFVAASRARDTTTIVVDAKGIDRRLAAELPIDRQRDDLHFPAEQRQAWLAERLSRASLKISTLDVIEAGRHSEQAAQLAHDRHREGLGYEL
jgi:ATP-dependent exoDNAse (exonuclease V) alpha subunit